MDTRYARALAELRDAAAAFVDDGDTWRFCLAFNDALGGLCSVGPLPDGLLLDLFWAVEAWEPPGPTRVAAAVELRRLAVLVCST